MAIRFIFLELNLILMKSATNFMMARTLLASWAFWGALSAAAGDQFQIQIAGLKPNDTIPQRFVYNRSGCSGGNVSPEVSWSGAPEAKSFALVVWDQDAPVGGGFYHWVIVNLPRASKKLAEGAGNVANHQAPSGTIQLVNDWGERGYGGPCPPGGRPHRYHFILYVLNVEQLPLNQNTKLSEAIAQIRKNAAASAEVVLLYGG